MTMRLLPLAALLLPLPALAQTGPDVAALRDAALGDKVAWDITEGLTTEIGQRLQGTPAEARARDWSVAKLKALGFANVRIETYKMPVWLRGEETAEVTAPFPQKLVVTALGNSGSTGAKGVEAEIVYFPTHADLVAAPEGSLKGKIAFVSHAMAATQDGSSYGAFGLVRRAGPRIAAQKGAAAILIRSIGTDYHRNPHTGGTQFQDVTPIPAGALSIPDAEQLERILKRGQPVKVKLTLTPRVVKDGEGGNVIAEVPGSDPAAGVVLVACHLDSWDLGTGAFDDATGCGIVAAAAKRILDSGVQPRRTIRILWAGAEENGTYGGKAYFAAHGGERHALASESDSGGDRVWKFDAKLSEGAAPIADRLAAALAPLGIARGTGEAGDGADIDLLHKAGVAAIDLAQDATRYFAYHHTPDDTLDKVDLSQLQQNVAAWTAMLTVTAYAPEDIGAVPPKR
jgi:carboxypeptidase Q